MMRKRMIGWVLVAATVVAMLGSVTTADAATTNRTQATRAAKNYLAFTAFSLKGLIKQLKYEGYSTSDSTYGASHAGANWNKQAVKAAKNYLDFTAFSFSGMVKQLRFEGYTNAQAIRGARGAGL